MSAENLPAVVHLVEEMQLASSHLFPLQIASDSSKGICGHCFKQPPWSLGSICGFYVVVLLYKVAVH
jgi:hypothetical protein